MLGLPSAGRQRPQMPGVIDTLTAGYTLVNRHAWLLAIPLLLDLALWWGPQLSVAPLIADLVRVTLPPAELGSEYAQALEQARLVLTQTGQELNLFGLLAAGFLGVPSLLGVSAAVTDAAAAPLLIQITSWLLVFPVAVGLVALSTWIASAYLSPIAQIAQDGRASAATVLRRAWSAGWRLLAFTVLLLGLLVLAGVPAMFLVSVVALLNAGIASFLMGLAWIALLWLAFYLFFVVPAVTVGQSGVLRSIWNSVSVVRWNLGSSLGLIVITNVIQRGLPLVWRPWATEPLGVLAGIVGNAYIGTGLMAASMIFYRDRFAVLQEALARARAAGKAGAAGSSTAQSNGG